MDLHPFMIREIEKGVWKEMQILANEIDGVSNVKNLLMSALLEYNDL